MSDINPQLALPALAEESGVLVPVAVEPSTEAPSAPLPEGLPGPGDETVYV
ncbi:MAG: hypothetical protein ACKODA_02905 [Nevskiaceae bacterium]